MPKSYPPQFRRRVIDPMCAGGSASNLAGDLVICEAMIHRRVAQEGVDPGERPELKLPTIKHRSRALASAATRAADADRISGRAAGGRAPGALRTPRTPPPDRRALLEHQAPAGVPLAANPKVQQGSIAALAECSLTDDRESVIFHGESDLARRTWPPRSRSAPASRAVGALHHAGGAGQRAAGSRVNA